MQIIPKNELVTLLKAQPYQYITDEWINNFFEEYGDGYFPRCQEDPAGLIHNQKRLKLLKK